MKTTFGKYWLAALAALITFFASAAAYAQTVDVAKLDRDKWFAMAGALGLGIAALGGGLGQGKAAAAALEGIARNPGASGKILVPMILGLALIESLVIYALVIAFQLSGKIS